MLRDEPLPVTSSIRNWFTREGGRIARSLRQALQLPNDTRYFVDSSDEAITARLQWYTIVVMFNLYLLNCCFSISWFFFCFCFYLHIFVALLGCTTGIHDGRQAEKCNGEG